MSMTDREVLLLLNRIPSCNARKVRVLLDVVGNVQDIIKEEHLKTMSKATLFGARFVQSIRENLKTFDCAHELRELEKQSIKIITFLDDEYPRYLLEIHDPPVLLYVKGEIIPQDNMAVSIVGSRKASFYGQEMAEKLACQLALRGITVVSGMAMGIDSAAHRGALKAGGRTIAVLGCGVDIMYPANNKKLHETIMQHGAVVSEYPLGTEPFHYNFPKRNRIISGMSRGTVVVEAAKRSGSLITARLALDEGREVYSVPGKADSFNSAGTNNLIKEGARLITHADEIIEDLFPQLEEMKTPVSSNILDSESNRVRKRQTLDENARKVLSCLNFEPVHIEQLTQITDIPESEMYSILAVLEITHHAKRLVGGGYIKSGV
ncbi:MAG: DNA-processing protein DprA [Candidatus Omnitrophica bacterium]|nr:DNA-processing protein DprA [Candidatus Omnitrophota bacterium]